MSWLASLMKSECLCKRSCCTSNVHIKVNRKQFWKSIDDMKKSEETFHSSDKLMFEEVINLSNKTGYQSVLSIGLDPENEFHIEGRLEIKNKESVLRLNHNQLNCLLNFLKEFEHQIFHALPVRHTVEKYNLCLHLKQGRNFELCVYGGSININEDSLDTLCRMRVYILRLLSSFEHKSKKCETLFFKLLDHFCFGKTEKEAHDLVGTEYTRSFFEELSTFHCKCLDKLFITEFAAHFERWFVKCVPVFIKVMMLNESERLKTFSSIEWPHSRDIISVKNLAKSGLFYTGVMDYVKCVFCGLVLHKWMPNDNPVLDHVKYKPTCPFIRNHESSLNVSDVGEISELVELLSVLNHTSVNSFDEVDQSSTF